MESLKLKSDSLYDPIRKKWVEKNPEELIRQLLVRQMIEKLGYPPALIAIEKELSQLPHDHASFSKPMPKRRVDLVVFAKNGQSLKALLMIECKAVPLTPKFAQQVIGYNAFVRAPFVALANETQVLTGFFDKSAGIYKFKLGLASYEALIHQVISNEK